MSIYRVKGHFHFRGHAPGATFEAVLEPDAEKRALTRGNIEILLRGNPKIEPDKIRRPKG